MKKYNCSSINKFWLNNYRNIHICDSDDGHWGSGQTGLNFAIDGTINLSDNKPLRDYENGGVRYPNHRDLITGDGESQTVYSSIYTFGSSGGTVIWLYPFAERVIHLPIVKEGLASLIGIHRITKETLVRSNSQRDIIFVLGEV